MNDSSYVLIALRLSGINQFQAVIQEVCPSDADCVKTSNSSRLLYLLTVPCTKKYIFLLKHSLFVC